MVLKINDIDLTPFVDFNDLKFNDDDSKQNTTRSLGNALIIDIPKSIKKPITLVLYRIDGLTLHNIIEVVESGTFTLKYSNLIGETVEKTYYCDSIPYYLCSIGFDDYYVANMNLLEV